MTEISPALVARISVSIFIASIMITTSPSATSSPSLTNTLKILPAKGAFSGSPPVELAVGAAALLVAA